MTNRVSVTVYIAVDCNGEFTVGADTDEVNEKACNDLVVGYQIHEFEIDLPLPDVVASKTNIRLPDPPPAEKPAVRFRPWRP
jgi:hypothetical protein